MGDSSADRFEQGIETRVARLSRECDELRVHSHLAAADLREEWAEIEERPESLKTASGEARSAGVGVARHLVGKAPRNASARILARREY